MTAAGFCHSKVNEIQQEITKFREDLSHKLFPPIKDWSKFWGDLWSLFKTEDLGKECVSFSRNNPISWEEKIRLHPILKQGVACPPDYWMKKPHIQAE